MTMRQAFILSLILCAIALIFSRIVSPSMPDIVATHWNAQGHVDGRGSKATALYLMPGIMVFNALLMLALPKLSPKKFEIEGFTGAYSAVWVVIEAMFLFIHFILLQGARNEAIDITRWMMPVMFFFFALMGNWMGKIRQNFYMGVRTPWTLADTRVWDATHRLTGKLWFYGGILGAIVAAAGTPLMVSIVLLLAISLYPVYFSWAIYKRLNP